MSVTEDQRKIARAVATVFGASRPPVTRFWDNNHVSSVFLLEATDSPVEGVTSVSTVGLSDHSLDLMVDGKQLRVELVGACASDTAVFPNMLSTCAFYVINSHHRCGPGAIFENVVSMYDSCLDMKHVLLVPPFLWEKEFETLEFPDRTVTWLQVVPISEGERLYALEHGAEALENLLEEREIDVLDLHRQSEV
jgi:hypothetical protein